MGNLHSEQHLVNELAVKTLKAISKNQAIPYSKIKNINYKLFMEIIGKGISIKHIFLDRDNWRRFH